MSKSQEATRVMERIYKQELRRGRRETAKQSAVDGYINKMRERGTWGGIPEIVAAMSSGLFGNIVVWRCVGAASSGAPATESVEMRVDCNGCLTRDRGPCLVVQQVMAPPRRAGNWRDAINILHNGIDHYNFLAVRDDARRQPQFVFSAVAGDGNCLFTSLGRKLELSAQVVRDFVTQEMATWPLERWDGLGGGDLFLPLVGIVTDWARWAEEVGRAPRRRRRAAPAKNIDPMAAAMAASIKSAREEQEKRDAAFAASLVAADGGDAFVKKQEEDDAALARKIKEQEESDAAYARRLAGLPGGRRSRKRRNRRKTKRRKQRKKRRKSRRRKGGKSRRRKRR